MTVHQELGSDPTPDQPGSVDAVIFDVVLVAFATVIVVASFGLRPGPRLVPLVIGVPTLVALVMQLGIDVARLRKPAGEMEESNERLDIGEARMGELFTAAAREEAEDAELPAGEDARRRQLMFALWAAGVGVLAVLTTFYIAAPIGLLTILIAVGRSPGRAVAITAAVLVSLYLLFDTLLGVPF